MAKQRKVHLVLSYRDHAGHSDLEGIVGASSSRKRAEALMQQKDWPVGLGDIGWEIETLTLDDPEVFKSRQKRKGGVREEIKYRIR